MKIRHISISPDFAMSLVTSKKTLTRRPMKPQPMDLCDGKIVFGCEGFESSIYAEDYPCPFGESGDLLIFYFEGNSNSFFEAKHMGRRMERLLDIPDDDLKKEGFDAREEFIAFWDAVYGETEFSSNFNPWVWRIQFCKN